MGISSALGSSALLPAGLGFRNLVINGGMAIDQRNSGSSATSASAGYVWPVDRFKFYQAAGSKITGQRLAKSSASTNAPTGFQYSLKLTNAASGTTPAAGDEYELYHIIEGNSLANLDWGYSTAKPIVLSFWVRSSVTGTYAVSLYNYGTSNRSYVSTYTVNAADTWEQKTIYVNGDTSGTWTIGASNGLGIIWDMGSGANFSTTAGTWASGFYTRTTGATTWISTANATFYITGVQLEQNYQPTPFEQRPYGVELALCQRYYQRHDLGGAYFMICAPVGAGNGLIQYSLPVPMRAAPTLAASSGSMLRPLTTGGSSVGTTNSTSVGWYSTATQYGGQVYFSGSSGLTAGAAVGVYINAGGWFEFTGAEL